MVRPVETVKIVDTFRFISWRLAILFVKGLFTFMARLTFATSINNT